MDDLSSHKTRETLAGRLIGSYTCVCFCCREMVTVGAGSMAGASYALKGKGWRTSRGKWLCAGCYGRERGYKELERQGK